MSCIPYTFASNCVSSRICETPPPIYQAVPQPGLEDLPPEELARIRGILRKLTAVRIRNWADAEDLVQETLLTMTIKRPQTDLRKSLLVWGIGILRRKLGNYYKKSRRSDVEDHAKAIAWRQWRQKEQTLSPEMRVRQEELRSLIDRIVACLPTCEQEALNLHLAGLPAHEIVLQLYPERYQNVINHLYRGRQKLAKELRRHGYRL